MCISSYEKITSIDGVYATMQNGRLVRLADVSEVSVGDFLEVYADIAIRKVEAAEAHDIQRAQEKKGKTI